MAGENDEWVYDEATGEWRPAAEMTAPADAGPAVVRDASGNVLADGDSVTLNNGPLVNVQDDIPIGPDVDPTCEDNVTGNDPDAPLVTNNLGISIGTDEPLVIETFQYTGPPLTAGGGFPVLFSTVGNVITGYIDTNGGAPGGEDGARSRP